MGDIHERLHHLSLFESNSASATESAHYSRSKSAKPCRPPPPPPVTQSTSIKKAAIPLPSSGSHTGTLVTHGSSFSSANYPSFSMSTAVPLNGHKTLSQQASDHQQLHVGSAPIAARATVETKKSVLSNTSSSVSVPNADTFASLTTGTAGNYPSTTGKENSSTLRSTQNLPRMNYEVTPPKPFGMTEAEKKVRSVPLTVVMMMRINFSHAQMLSISPFFRWKR